VSHVGPNARHRAVGRIVEGGVVAVLRDVDADEVVPVARAVVEGGVRAVEVTADTPGAMDQVAAVAEDLGDVALVGAGTVLDAETARAALLAGSAFVVSPSFHRDVVEVCNRYGAPVVPGVATPTEAVEAYAAGADLVKLFPAAALGPAYLAALQGPLSQIPVMPTGGIDAANAGAFVEAGAVAVGAGSSIVDADAMARGDLEAVTERARALVEAVDSAR